MKNSIVTPLDQIGRFDTIIDVRSPAEFAEDHIPGAINCPVLDNEQRAQVGTLYKRFRPLKRARSARPSSPRTLPATCARNSPTARGSGGR